MTKFTALEFGLAIGYTFFATLCALGIIAGICYWIAGRRRGNGYRQRDPEKQLKDLRGKFAIKSRVAKLMEFSTEAEGSAQYE